MPTNWGFRRILSVNPELDHQCVGYAPSKGRRCTKPINRFDQPAACHLLDQMDRSDALLDAIDDLEELAGLLLCNEWHNSAKRPQHSQVRQVYSKWERCVKEEHVRLSEREERDTRREAEGEAERLAVRVAETSRRLERIVQRVAEAERVDTERIEAERLAEIVAETSRRRMAQQIAEAERLAAEREAERLAAMDVMTDVEEEVQELVPLARPQSVQWPATNVADNEDPFVTQGASSSRPNLFTSSTPSNNSEERRENVEDKGILSSTSTSRERLEEQDLLASMPSVPTHNLSSSITNNRIAIAKQQEAKPTTITSESSSLAKFAHVFGVRSESQPPNFEFETPMRPRPVREETISSASTSSSTAFSSFTIGTANSSAATTPEKEAAEEPEPLSLEKGRDKAVDTVPSDHSPSSTYASGSGSGKEPESKHPVTPQRPSIRYDPTIPSSRFFQSITAENKESTTQIASTQASQRRAGEPSTPVNKSPSDDPAQPSTPHSPNEEKFGYAYITPNSTRYTTYLPVRRHHGLPTPPESPEMFMEALNKPMSDSGCFQDDRRRGDDSPTPRITRKPLPRSPPNVPDGGVGREQVCDACGRIDGLRVAQCGCGEEELEVPSGCLQRFGFRRLKEKAKALRESFGKRNEFKTPVSSDGIALE